MLRAIILISILFISIPASAELNLKRLHPDEPADYTFAQRFSFESSLSSLTRMKSALESFRKLTEVTKNKISKSEAETIGNTGWETQYLGFENWPNSIEGTLYKQKYLIKKLEYELAVEREKNGQVNKIQLDIAKKEFEQAEKKFQSFWDSFSIGD